MLAPRDLNRKPARRLLRATAVLAILLLTACTTLPLAPPETPEDERPAVSHAPPGAEVLPLPDTRPIPIAHTGRAEFEAALLLPSPQREHRLLEVADLAIVIGDHETAGAALEAVDPERLDYVSRARHALTEGRLAMLLRQAGHALNRLPADTDGLPLALVAEIVEARAEAFRMAGLIPQSVEQRVALERMLPTREAIALNRAALWETLMLAGGLELLHWAERASSEMARGWFELARIVKINATHPDALDREIAGWRTAWPDHPADLSFLADLRRDWQPVHLEAGRIAVLLPLSGRFASAGSAILDGILAAYHDAPQAHRPTLRIYDVGDASEAISTHYRQAVAEGASIVIGPLDKDAVARLATAPNLPVPVLALNVADDVPPPPGLYQFGLNPGDETRQAAERAAIDGMGRAVILAPANEWGDRLARSFEQQFVELGGRILAVARFDPGAPDHSATITELLHIDRSRARHRQLQSAVGVELRFEPRRRQDIDAVFLVATPPQARLLQSQLRFHYAHDLPILATSHIYSGVPDPRSDGDLDGITYCDIPWLIDGVNPRPDLRSDLDAVLSPASRGQPRLVALGIDAYGVLPVLTAIEARRMRYDGVTGQLWTDGQGIVHRDLRCLRFRDGVPLQIGGASAPARSAAAP